MTQDKHHFHYHCLLQKAKTRGTLKVIFTSVCSSLCGSSFCTILVDVTLACYTAFSSPESIVSWSREKLSRVALGTRMAICFICEHDHLHMKNKKVCNKTRRCGSVYLGVDVLRVCELFYVYI